MLVCYFFACVHEQMCVYIHVGVCTCAHMNVEDRGQYRCLPQSLSSFFFFFLRLGLFLGMKLVDLAKLVNQ